MRQNSQKLWTKSAVGLLLGLLLVSAAAADVKLPAVFGDHMVLQRDVPLPVWGWADPGEKVTVTLGEPVQDGHGRRGGQVVGQARSAEGRRAAAC